jgi:hypothetical protein
VSLPQPAAIRFSCGADRGLAEGSRSRDTPLSRVAIRWGELSALRRADLDLMARTARLPAADAGRSTPEKLIGPPKSKASRRILGILAAIIPVTVARKYHPSWRKLAFSRSRPTWFSQSACTAPGHLIGPA